MLWYHSVYCFTDNQSLKEQGRRTHIHIPHTLLVPHSLIHCCHGNPIKGGQSGNNSGEIILSPFYLSLSLSLVLSHTCIHLPFLSLPAISILSPSITFSFLTHCPSPPLLASPLAHLSARLSPLLCYLFIFSPPGSYIPGECKYVISLLKGSLHL